MEEEYWELVCSSWKTEADQRPTFSHLILQLNRFRASLSAHPPSQNISNDLEPRTKEMKEIKRELEWYSEKKEKNKNKRKEQEELKEWEIEPKDLFFHSQIGAGSFARVFSGEYRGQRVAIKVLNDPMDPKTLIDFQKELSVLSKIRSPRMVYFYGGILRPNLCCLITEFMSNGTLYHLLQDSTRYSLFLSSLPSSTSFTPSFSHHLHSVNEYIDNPDLSLSLSFFDSQATEPDSPIHPPLSSLSSSSPSSSLVLSLGERQPVEVENGEGWRGVKQLAIEVAEAIHALHQWRPPVVHRDIKSLNLLLDQYFHVKVADLGLSRFTTEINAETLNKFRGTYLYVAPESYSSVYPTSIQSDVYSYGIVLWEIVHRHLKGFYQRPYSEHSHLVHDFQIIIQVSKKGLRPQIAPECPPLYVNLMKGCWESEPQKRPTISQILKKLKSS